MKLIVGLGNPGLTYQGTRHNIGFKCLRHFARTQGIRFDRKSAKARIGSGSVAGGEVVLARPQTFMNLSGQAVGRLVAKFDVALPDLLVVHDDLDLPLGKIRLRQGGGSGGHNGIESIIAELGSREFARLRVGIGRPAPDSPLSQDDEGVVSYVLGRFSPEEKRVVSQILPRVSEAIFCFLRDGLQAAMNLYN